jgi:hypothetical protein
MDNLTGSQEATLREQEKPVAVAQLRFTDNPDGSMSIEATHAPEVFEPMNQSHAILRAVTQYLPVLCTPIGIDIKDGTGYKLPINDGERYQALRALAFLPDAERDAILAAIGLAEPGSEAEFDAYADKLVEYARTITKANAEQSAIAGAEGIKLASASGGVLN